MECSLWKTLWTCHLTDYWWWWWWCCVLRNSHFRTWSPSTVTDLSLFTKVAPYVSKCTSNCKIIFPCPSLSNSLFLIIRLAKCMYTRWGAGFRNSVLIVKINLGASHMHSHKFTIRLEQPKNYGTKFGCHKIWEFSAMDSTQSHVLV